MDIFDGQAAAIPVVMVPNIKVLQVSMKSLINLTVKENKMKETIEKMKDKWKKFESEHVLTAKLTGATLASTALTAALTASTYLAFLAFPPAVPVYLVLTLVATAAGIETLLFGAGSALAFDSERKNTFTNSAGEKFEGPNWAIRRLSRAEGRLKQMFQKQAEIAADPLIAEARMKVTVAGGQPRP